MFLTNEAKCVAGCLLLDEYHPPLVSGSTSQPWSACRHQKEFIIGLIVGHQAHGALHNFGPVGFWLFGDHNHRKAIV
jgi:hypothetical protein